MGLTCASKRQCRALHNGTVLLVEICTHGGQWLPTKRLCIWYDDDEHGTRYDLKQRLSSNKTSVMAHDQFTMHKGTQDEDHP